MTESNTKGVYIPHKILTDSQIGSTHKLVYAVMAMNADHNGVCPMTGEEIADWLGISKTAAVHARWNLVKCGYVQRVPFTKHDFQVMHFRRKGGGEDA